MLVQVGLLLFIYAVLSSGVTFFSNIPCDANIELVLDGDFAYVTTATSKFACALMCAETTGCDGVLYYRGSMACYGVSADSPMYFACALSGAEFYKPGCAFTRPLVMNVNDSQLTASSSWDWRQPSEARLNNTNNHWTPLATGLNEYIQVDFLSPKVVCEVITQGGAHNNRTVTSYKIITSRDCSTFKTLKDRFGNDKVFYNEGELRRNKLFQKTLDTPIVVQCLRISPQTFYGAVACLRFETLGCDP